MAGTASLLEDIERICAAALEEPAEGRTLWAFRTRSSRRSLEPEDVAPLIESGKGVYLVELVWTEKLELAQRGRGQVIRGHDDLRKVLGQRVKHLAGAPKDDFDRPSAPVKRARRT